MQRRSRLPPSWFLAACGLLVVRSVARAEPIDATTLQRVWLEPARGPSPKSEQLLPRAPKVRWRVRVGGSVLHAPVVSQDGAIVLALGSQSIAQYDSAGKLSWLRKLGASSAAVSPWLAADGSRLVLTESGELLTFSERGERVARVALPLGGADLAPEIGALQDGGLVVAQGRRIVELDARRNFRLAARAPADVRALVAGRTRPLLVTITGVVLELRSDGELLELGAFAGRVDAVVALSESKLLGLLDGRRLSELDLKARTLTARLAEPDLDLAPPIARNGSGQVRMLAGADLLLGLDPGFAEHFRSPLPATAIGTRVTRAEIAVDPDGAALVARPGQDLVAVAPDGGATRVPGTACAEPLQPSALAAHSAVFACRSGIVLRLDEARVHR